MTSHHCGLRRCRAANLLQLDHVELAGNLGNGLALGVLERHFLHNGHFANRRLAAANKVVASVGILNKKGGKGKIRKRLPEKGLHDISPNQSTRRGTAGPLIHCTALSSQSETA